MITHSFQGESLSTLGFGTMRLPMLPGSREIDQQELDRMVDAAIAGGVNYFETAYPYHGGKSEVAIGRSLSRYPRESWNLADKFPGHQNIPGVQPLQPAVVFEEQLRRCGVTYFDYYLLHNVNENSMSYYGNPDNSFMEFFLEQKARGRIRHLGFSCHAAPECLSRFLELYGKELEFCQIQLNYVDWVLQGARKKVEILREAGIPVWVMEPTRGGRLANLPEEWAMRLHGQRPEESTAAWAFRWLQTVPQPTMILSGMSTLSQMEDNLKTFSTERPLTGAELTLLDEVRGSLSRFIPCTGCRYCCAGCPRSLDIPTLLSMSNDMAFFQSLTVVARYSALGQGHQAAGCIGCGQCTRACPQKIDVPSELRALAALMSGQKTWEQVCRERADREEHRT